MGRDEEQKFLSLLAEKRHKELIEALSKLSVTVQTEQPSKEMMDILQNIADRKESNELPEGAVSISKTIISNLVDVKTEIKNGFDRLIKSRSREWRFEVNYNTLNQPHVIKAKVVE